MFVAIYIDPAADDETAVRRASRAATLKGVRVARRAAVIPRRRTALVERRDSVASPF